MGKWSEWYASSLHEFSAIYEIPSTSLITYDTETKQNLINHQPLTYYKFIPEKMTWAEHNKQAISMGGNLASISNARENNKVKEVPTGVNVWLGESEKDVETTLELTIGTGAMVKVVLYKLDEKSAR